jgi:hypothetical protein
MPVYMRSSVYIYHMVYIYGLGSPSCLSYIPHICRTDSLHRPSYRQSLQTPRTDSLYIHLVLTVFTDASYRQSLQTPHADNP